MGGINLVSEPVRIASYVILDSRVPAIKINVLPNSHVIDDELTITEKRQELVLTYPVSCVINDSDNCVESCQFIWKLERVHAGDLINIYVAVMGVVKFHIDPQSLQFIYKWQGRGEDVNREICFIG